MNLSEMTWPAVAALDKNTPVIIPVAALEQHGHHLPVFTDSMLLGEIMRRAAQKLSDRVLLAPLLWLGNSDHHLDFPGTLSAQPRTYLDVLSGLAENFLSHGFKRIVFINGHGGNDVPGKQALFEVRQRQRQRTDLLLMFATYWHLVEGVADAVPNGLQHEMGHACEWETSMILRIAPHLVDPGYTQLESVPFGDAFSPAFRAWITRERTVPGHIGDPQHATAEKGEVLLTVFSQGVIDLLERVLRWDGISWNG